MALIQASNPGQSAAEQLAWQIDEFELTDPFSSGETLTLTQTAIENSVILYSEGPPLSFGSWQFNAPNEVELLFGADPSTDTDDGVWNIYVQYQYAT